MTLFSSWVEIVDFSILCVACLNNPSNKDCSHFLLFKEKEKNDQQSPLKDKKCPQFP